jgi:glyoxylase-like metal-dependent hydrolase (beta-lactamase superfamily II)
VNLRIIPLIASTFASDGGTMFGLIPRSIWVKRVTPDERNRIVQHARSLLVELSDGRKGLIETGCGSADLFSEKEREIHALGPGWPLMENLDRIGLKPDAIDFVVFTHLHWDHAGGASRPADNGARRLTFPNATHYVHTLEWKDALSKDPLLHKSYPEGVIAPLHSAQARFHFTTDRDTQVRPGLRLVRTSGHTRGHSMVLFEADEILLEHPGGGPSMKTRAAIFAGDICPSHHHLRMVAQTNYDTFPLKTRAWKRRWLPWLARKHGVLLFDHDPELLGTTLRPDPKEEMAVETEWPVTGYATH